MGETGECKLFFVVRMRSGRRRKRLSRKALDTKNRRDYHTVNLSDGGCINDRSCRRQDALEIVRRGYSGALSRFVEMFRCIVVNILILKYVGDVGIRMAFNIAKDIRYQYVLGLNVLTLTI